jgi:hypothetical protein
MPEPEPTLQVPLSLDQGEVTRLGAILGVEGEALQTRLSELAAAALKEYALAFTGVRSPSTIREVRELRLRLLYEFLPPDVPSDQQVGRLFQMTPSAAGTLIANTRARFESELDERLRTAAENALKAGQELEDGTVRIRASDSLARYLKDIVARTAAPPLDKRKDASQTYDLMSGTVAVLCDQLGIDPGSVAKQ